MAMSAEAVAALELTRRGYDQIAGRRRFVSKAEDYYRGKQRLRYASEKWAEYNAARYRDFADNWCAPVANSPNERLRVTGFRLDDDPSSSPEEKNLWRDWLANDMDAQSSQGFLSSIVTGRSYVMVWGTPDDEPVMSWERSDQATVLEDPGMPGRPIAAVKTWHDDRVEYATTFTATSVFKWQRPWLDTSQVDRADLPPRGEAFFRTPAGVLVPAVNRDEWQPRLVVGEVWPLPNPLGVIPMVEMPNRPVLGGDPLSDIGGTMAMQDAINLLWAYLFAAADFASMPARVVMGQDPPKMPILDANGQKVGEKPIPLEKIAKDRILWLTGENSKIGQWDAARLDVFTSTIETAVTHVAAQTRTPPHYLVLGKGMVNVNAEGMKTAETGLVMKVREMQLFLSGPVRGVFGRAALVRGDRALADRCRFGTVEWRDAENHSEAQLVDALQKLGALGFPFAWLAERYGLSQTELDRVLAMRKAEQQADPLAQIVANAGQQPALPPAAG